MNIKIILGAATALSLAGSLAGCASMMGDDGTGGGSMGQSGMSQGAMSADMTPSRGMPYVAMAGASDMYEIQSSQMQQQMGQDPRLHQFAAMMITDHTNTTQATMASARAARLDPPPPMLMPMQRDMIARLQALSGQAFDREYQRQQVVAHQMALALHQNYARNGDVPSLRMSAQAAVPVVRMHLDQIRGMRM